MEVDKLILEDWSKTTLGYYLGEVERVGEDVATSFYNQSDLSRVKNCELMIIGINPGAGCLFSQWGLKDHALSNSDFLYRGNPCFQGLSDKEIIYEMSQKYDKDKKRYGWDLWKKIHKMLGYAGKGELLEKPDKFVLTNMVFFGTAHQGQIPQKIDQEYCAKQTLELIDILKPKVVLLLGDQTRDLFKKIANISHMEELIPNYHDFYCFYNNIHVISIYHTAYYSYFNFDNMAFIGNILGYALDNSRESIDKNKLERYLYGRTIIRAIRIKNLLNRTDAISLIDSDKALSYDLWQTIKKSNYVKSKDNIVIDLTPEEDKKQYVLLVFTRQNNEEKTKELIKGIWPNEEFHPWECDKSRHVHKVISFEVSNEEIKNIMEKVLNEVKAYRDKEYPLK